MAITHTIPIAAGSDDAEFFNGAFNNTRNYNIVGSHANTTLGPWTGWRFLVPDTINPAHITSVHIKLYKNNNATTKAYFRVKQTAQNSQWDNSTNKPKDVWDASPTLNQGYLNVTTSNVVTSAEVDITVQVVSALSNITLGVDYLGITAGPSEASGANGQWASYEHTTISGAELIIVTDPPPEDGEAFPVSALFNLTVSNVEADTAKIDKDISYHDGIGSSTRRHLDVLRPENGDPPEGYPIVLHMHGGGFSAGNKNEATSKKFMQDCLASGYAIVAMNYKLTAGNIVLNTNTGFTHTSVLQDVFAVHKWIQENAHTYNLNPNFIIHSGYSAGGYLALLTALLIEDQHRSTYEIAYRGVSSANGSRYDEFPVFNPTEGRASFPSRVRGVFTFGGPVSLSYLSADVDLLRPIVNLYFGALPQSSFIMSQIQGEGDINRYITADVGSIWEGRRPQRPSFPIGSVYTTNDLVVPPNSGYNPLFTALSSVGYDVSMGGLNLVHPGTGLSSFSYTGIHDRILYTYPSMFFRRWLENIKSHDTNDSKFYTLL